MNIQYSAKRMFVRPAHTMYIASVFALLSHINLDYVSKMVYNKDKDLVFVYKQDALWSETEHVYEMHHLEQMVPAPVTSYKNLSMARDDGIVTVHCMSTKDYLKFYNEDKYWNLDVKEDFLSQTRSLWRGQGDKYEGRIFQVPSPSSEEIALTQMKVDRELQEAIAKHGEVVLPKKHEDEFYERIKKKQEEILSRAGGAGQ